MARIRLGQSCAWFVLTPSVPIRESVSRILSRAGDASPNLSFLIIKEDKIYQIYFFSIVQTPQQWKAMNNRSISNIDKYNEERLQTAIHCDMLCTRRVPLCTAFRFKRCLMSRFLCPTFSWHLNLIEFTKSFYFTVAKIAHFLCVQVVLHFVSFFC